jgi:acyl carrier protein
MKLDVSVKAEIIEQFSQVAREQNKQLAPLADDLPLFDSGLDSLCFAIIVVRLETALGVDPFSTDEEVHFPVTFGDFIGFYENAAK